MSEPMLVLLDVQNIYQYPKNKQDYDPTRKNQLVLGDTHGNFMYLMHLLVLHNVILNLTEEAYLQLSAIYLKNVDDITYNDLTTFNQILSKLEFNPNIPVLSLGDDVGDRGNNDYFTLKLIHAINNNPPRSSYKSLLSNHGFEFVQSHDTNNFSGKTLEGPFIASLTNLVKLQEAFPHLEKEVEDLVQRDYKRNLLALSCHIDVTTNEVIIYSHAPIDLHDISDLCEELKQPFNDDSPLELMRTITQVNAEFQRRVQANSIHSLVEFKESSQDDPAFTRLTWNRKWQGLKRTSPHKNMTIRWVHGHDSSCPSIPNSVYNLDVSNVGKTSDEHAGRHAALLAPIASILEAKPKNAPIIRSREADSDIELDEHEAQSQLVHNGIPNAAEKVPSASAIVSAVKEPLLNVRPHTFFNRSNRDKRQAAVTRSNIPSPVKSCNHEGGGD
jgi:hypothetical protein